MTKQKRMRLLDFNDFKWVLSSLGMVGNLYNAMGHQKQCESVYVSYVTMVEDFFEKDSSQAGNAYFMMGGYYYEQNQFSKSLACYLKAHLIRKKD